MSGCEVKSGKRKMKGGELPTVWEVVGAIFLACVCVGVCVLGYLLLTKILPKIAMDNIAEKI